MRKSGHGKFKGKAGFKPRGDRFGAGKKAAKGSKHNTKGASL